MKFFFSGHVFKRMAERGFSPDAIKAVIKNGTVIKDYPDDTPYPSRLILGYDGERPVHVVSAYNPAEDKEYVIKAEFNTSFDYNDHYTKKNSGVNGQPSVIYSAKIPAGFNKENDEIKLSFEGCGSIDGSDGIVQSDVSKLTTATEIVKLITVKAVK